MANFIPVGEYRCFPTHCQYCQRKVFYYQNENGSKLFFDELGPPWPVHRCAEYRAVHGRKTRQTRQVARPRRLWSHRR